MPGKNVFLPPASTRSQSCDLRGTEVLHSSKINATITIMTILKGILKFFMFLSLSGLFKLNLLSLLSTYFVGQTESKIYRLVNSNSTKYVVFMQLILVENATFLPYH